MQITTIYSQNTPHIIIKLFRCKQLSVHLEYFIEIASIPQPERAYEWDVTTWLYPLHLYNICYCFRFLNWSKLRQNGVFLSQTMIFSSEGRKHSTNMQSGNRNWSLWYWSPWAASAWTLQSGCVNPNRRLLLQGQSYTGRQHMLNTFEKHYPLIFRSASSPLGRALLLSSKGVHLWKCMLTFCTD